MSTTKVKKSKRPKGTGSVYRRESDGLYVAQLNGQCRYSKDKAVAETKLLAMLRDQDQLKPSNITVGTVLDQYLETAKQNLKSRTVERYRYVIDGTLMPAFGTTKLHKLTALQIEAAYARKLREGMAASTIHLSHAILSAACKRAVRLGLVQTNVCSQVQTPRVPHKHIEVFDPSEVERILSAAATAPLHALYVLALTTGARQAELLGLQIQDYNRENGTLAIRRSLWKGQTGTTKSRAGNRTITLPTRAGTALDGHIDKHNPDSYIFTTSTGKPYSSSHIVIHHWRPLLAAADVPYRTFHVCRHSVASTLLSKGLPINSIAAYMGHTPSVLLKTYSHLLPNSFDQIAAALE